MAPDIKYTKIFINNTWVESVSGKKFKTFNPHDGSLNAEVSEGDKRNIKVAFEETTLIRLHNADVDAAVSAAKLAFHRNSEWRLLDPSQRAKLLNKFADLVKHDLEYLVELETLDNGIVLNNNRLFMPRAIDLIRYNASWANKIEGTTIPVDGDAFAYTLKQPVGVCAIILPWNGPIMFFANKVSAALAAGCTVVVKPAEQTPLTALALAALVAEAGIPPGVVNVVPGYGETAGAALTHHKDVAHISFTGSVEVGKIIQRAAATNNLKRVTLELGGKSPLVIMNDADLDSAVQFAALGVFTNQGQICVAASRLFVQSGIYDEFVKRAIELAKTRKIGNPTDSLTQQGPQVDGTMMDKVLGYIDKGVSEGAKLETGGKRFGNTGYYIEPTVFTGVTDDMTIAKEEIFGPVQSILKFETFEEAIERANATNYGLAAGIFTSSVETALQFSKHVEAGVVWVNTYLNFGPQLPFGGFKESGIGREYGPNGVEAYLEVKTVTIALPKRI